MAANDNRPADERATQAKTSKTLAPKGCPICGKPRDSAYTPFCSRRCADVDLYRWLKGGYVIPGSREPEADGGDEA